MGTVKKYCFTSLLFFVVLGIKAQHAILDRFSASQIQSHVLIEWVISSGNSCNGIFIYRAGTDSVFESIGDIQGVCGDSEKPIAYRFKDSSPLPNQVNIYKLALGNQGYTDAISVRFFSNRAKDFTVVYNQELQAMLLVNDRMLGTQIEIYDLKGNPIQSIYIDQREFLIPNEKLRPGFYILVYTKARNIQTEGFLIR